MDPTRMHSNKPGRLPPAAAAPRGPRLALLGALQRTALRVLPRLIQTPAAHAQADEDMVMHSPCL
jgi:hypothetical protein